MLEIGRPRKDRRSDNELNATQLSSNANVVKAEHTNHHLVNVEGKGELIPYYLPTFAFLPDLFASKKHSDTGTLFSTVFQIERVHVARQLMRQKIDLSFSSANCRNGGSC